MNNAVSRWWKKALSTAKTAWLLVTPANGRYREHQIQELDNNPFEGGGTPW
jgi:hypothetical protein